MEGLAIALVIVVMGVCIAAAGLRRSLAQIQGGYTDAQTANRLAQCSRVTASERTTEDGSESQWLAYVDRK
jgi:hypothetical protein